jgi:DNA mismatch repair protein MutS
MSIIKKYFDYQTKFEQKYGQKKTIVLMQVGSFYEAYSTNNYGYNLHELSELLNLICTRRDKSIKEISLKNPEMLGFPSISLSKYLKILINNNYTVIVVDQVTPPPNPKRKVTGVYSAGTYIEEQNSPDSNNIISIYIQEEKQLDGQQLLAIGLSTIDLTTGKNIVHETYSISDDDKYALDETSRFIKMHSPKEIIITVNSLENYEKKVVSYLEIENFKYLYNDNLNKNYKKLSYQVEFLSKIFPNTGMLNVLEYLDLEKKNYGVISYMLLLDFAYNHNENILNNIYKPKSFLNNKHLILGNNAIMQLNILKNDTLEVNNKKYQCLFDVINYTSTALGRRFLKNELLNPLVSTKKLKKRYDNIEELIKNDRYLKIEEFLKNIIDIERLHRKISLNILHPMEFYNLHYSYFNIKLLFKYLKLNLYHLLPKEKYITQFNNFCNDYEQIFEIDEMNKYFINDITGSFFKKNIYPEIDSVQNEIELCLNFMDYTKNALEKLIDGKIYLKSNDRDGYYFSLTKNRAKYLKTILNKQEYVSINHNQKIKSNLFIFKELTKGNTKIFLPEMNKKSETVILLKDKMKNIIKEKYVENLTIFYKKYELLFKQLVNFICTIDFLKSGAKSAVMYNYCKPEINKKDKSYIKCTNLRHPIVERIQQDTEYVPNDITIGIDNQDGILLYGLNSSGKTVLMKAVGLSIILAQCGYYVPCKNYIYSPYNSLFARITGNDNIFKGLSSFALEMIELKAILKRTGQNTLVIGDEICRGTEQTSGNSIVAATIIKLANTQSSFIFASHLHDIPQMKQIKQLQNVKCYHLKVDYDKDTDNLIFNRKLNKGSGPNVYGLTVAKYLIHDNDFIKLAENIKKELVNSPNQILIDKNSPYNKDLYVHECAVCSFKNNLDTHHINFQKDCINGFVYNKEYIEKNAKCNLIILCKKCHTSVHQGKINIKGYKDTSNGKKLIYSYVDNIKKVKKYDDSTITIVKKLKNKNITQKNAKQILNNNHDIKISTSTISKIWNDVYI